MKTTEFIPGLWQEEINLTDFLNLNRKEYREDKFLCDEHELSFEKEYNVLVDSDRKFKIIKPYNDKYIYETKGSYVTFISESNYEKYVESGDNKKLRQMGLLRVNESGKESLFNPDICTVALYGTKHLTRVLKEYIRDLEAQLQNPEWIQRRIANNRSLEALYSFETFAEKNGVVVKKACQSSEEVANVLYITALYAVLESPQTPISYYSIFSFLDIFLEKEISKKIINEKQAQQIVDELYCKLAGLGFCLDASGSNLSYTVLSGHLCKTVYRLLESAAHYDMIKIPLQFVFNSGPMPESIIKRVSKLFELGHEISFSQSLRKRDATDLSISSSHTFFRNYEDITFDFGSFDLEKALMIAINGGRDVSTNSLLSVSSKPITKENITYEKVMIQFENFLKYYVTYYVQFYNSCAYYWDQYHELPFRQSLISSYPHYLMNMPYHNVKKTINLLSAIYDDKFDIKQNDKGNIEEIIPKTMNKEEFIGAKINDIIQAETSKMLFYKNGNFNVVFFSDSPYFSENNIEDLRDMSPISFLKTSYSGFVSLNPGEVESFAKEFKDTSYTHIQLYKKFKNEADGVDFNPADF